MHDDIRSNATGSGRSSPEDVIAFPGASILEKILGQRFSEWLRGPRIPRPYIIVPLGGSSQLICLQKFRTWFPQRQQRTLVGVAFFLIWILSFTLIAYNASSTDADSSRLACISRFWPSTEKCGLDGAQCLPFDNQTIAFRCPAYCSEVKVLNPYAIGVEEVNYQSLVIGGPTKSGSRVPNTYRGDSFICAAAIHAGVIDDKTGGCGTVSLIGTQQNYLGSEQNGISSVGFNSSFPLSFTFDTKTTTKSGSCKDPRWRAFGISALFTTILSLFTTSSSLFFGAVFSSVFFQTALASDPPDFPTYDGVVSAAVGRFLPAAFVGLFIYQYSVRYTLRDLKAHFEKTILWLGGCWIGAIGNNVFDKIPISRLTPHDLSQQPGAITALLLIIGVVTVIAFVQIWAFRIEGRLPRYLAFYAIIAASIIFLLLIPRLHLRLHHYILALILLPGTTLQTRPSLLYQGFLVGLFINGIARWGFDSVLQTDTALRTDEKLGSLLPQISVPIATQDDITFSLKLNEGYDGISMLVNDVERFRKFDEPNLTITWNRAEGNDVEYFRFGYVTYARLGGVLLQDYTKAGMWTADGHWTQMQPGPS
ncbi:hypothetical protein EJ08DRAFT_589721 [Tothia fuscella]|uniref:LCCL domain-containing protein n=1 Tax=Tothia fuscella TaxID=1048955 RepID=A0A9P4NRF1_9PEZI|nr:hypothetical protein EJ08DRAFT_589721 [Tothia fuscella]